MSPKQFEELLTIIETARLEQSQLLKDILSALNALQAPEAPAPKRPYIRKSKKDSPEEP